MRGFIELRISYIILNAQKLKININIDASSNPWNPSIAITNRQDKIEDYWT